MLLVPAGPFQFGDAPGQDVTLPAFYIDETEVSNAAYHRFCEATDHAPPPSPGHRSGVHASLEAVREDEPE